MIWVLASRVCLGVPLSVTRFTCISIPTPNQFSHYPELQI